jgi:hypothetical protein
LKWKFWSQATIIKLNKKSNIMKLKLLFLLLHRNAKHWHRIKKNDEKSVVEGIFATIATTKGYYGTVRLPKAPITVANFSVSGREKTFCR